jgi:flagellar basal body-associated protein FliL
MNAIWIILIVLAALFALVVLIYWFNLDTKLVKLLEKPMMKHYDKLKRDHRL